MDQKNFIKRYIKQINSSNFSEVFKKIDKDKNPFKSTTDLGEYLKNRLYLEFPKHETDIYEKWKEVNFVKSKVRDIANQYYFKESNLLNCLLRYVGELMCNELSRGNLDHHVDDFVTRLEGQYGTHGFKAIKTDFKKVFKNSLHFSLQRGFPINLANLNAGVMTANAGDSHQFLFLARAILAGFNCSNVDVRSSRYDAIIDYNEKLYKIQIKGINSSSTTIDFKDRDRGGQGIDHKHERNIGKKITSKDCDIYAAVDKNSGVCYLIPMKWVDKNSFDSLKIKDLADYKEKWDIFEDSRYF